MSSWAILMKTILGAGTWTNQGSQPITHILYTDSIRIKPPCIILENEDGETISDHKGKVLMRKKSGILTIVATNNTIRNNIFLDVHSILENCSYSHEVLSERPLEPQKNRFEYELNINILD